MVVGARSLEHKERGKPINVVGRRSTLEFHRSSLRGPRQQLDRRVRRCGYKEIQGTQTNHTQARLKCYVVEGCKDSGEGEVGL
jgi:hypothetical protein